MVNFADVDGEAFSLVSNAMEKKTMCDAECQTGDVEVVDAETDTTMKTDAETQSIMVMEEEKEPEMRRLGGLVTRMEEALGEDSSMFTEYEPLAGEANREVTYKYALECPQTKKYKRLQCVGVCWNATGSVLCAVFGRRNVQGWCEDPGFLACWSVFSKDFLPEKNPTQTIEHSTCLQVVVCHPVKPSLVAVGSFEGEVLIYDVSRGLKGTSSVGEEPLIGASHLNDYFHRDPITALTWLETDENDFQLLSLSGDGRILFWCLAWIDNQQLPYPLKGMTLARPPSAKDSVTTIGGTAMALLPTTQKSGRGGPLGLIVGTEGGRVLRYFAANQHFSKKKESRVTAKWDRRALDILAGTPKEERTKLIKHVEAYVKGEKNSGLAVVQPSDIFTSKPKPKWVFAPPQGAVGEFARHVGPVTSVAASPFHRHLFLSAGVDTNVKVFTTLSTAPLFKVDVGLSTAFTSKKEGALHGVDFSKARPCVFAVAGHSGIRIFDLASDAVALPAAELDVPVPALALQFNPRQRDFLAAGDYNAQVHVWQLSWHLSNPRKDEPAKLQAFIDTFVDVSTEQQ